MPRFTAYSPLFFLSILVRSLFSATQGGGRDGFVFGLSFPASVVIRDANFHRSYRHRFFSTADEKSAPALFPPSIHGRHRNFCSVSQIVARTREWHESRGGRELIFAREVFLLRGRVEFSPIIRTEASINFIGRGWMNWKARGVNCVQGEG